MALVDDILDFLRTNYQPAAGQFLRFDQQRLATKFRLADLGKERGAKDQPPSDATDLDTVELGIAEAMRQAALIDEGRAREELEHYTERLKSYNPSGQSAGLFVEADAAVSNFRGAMLPARTILDLERKEMVERDRALSAFKQSHDIERPPHPPKNHWIMGLALFVCFFLEVWANAGFLAPNSTFGWFGGAKNAVIYTFISMTLAFLLGRFALPCLTHSRWHVIILGFLATATLLAGFIFINVLAGHFRLAMTSVSEEEAGWQAMRTLASDPMAFSRDLHGLLMIGLSILVGVFATIEGFFWEDPYPGYSTVNKHALGARLKFIRSLENHRAELEEIYQEHAERIRAMQSSLANRQAEIPQALANRKRLVQSFNLHIKHIQDVGRFMMATYREANRETRKSPAPRYFSRNWTLSDVAPMDTPTDGDGGNASEWLRIDRQLKAASEALSTAHDEAVAWIRQLSQTESAAHADAGLAVAERKATEASEPDDWTKTDSARATSLSLTVVSDKAVGDSA